MKRNTFGDPRPKGFTEIVEAFDEKGFDPSESNAELTHEEAEGYYQGWSAEVRDNESGDEAFTTLGYAERDDLVKDLLAAGIKADDITDV